MSNKLDFEPFENDIGNFVTLLVRAVVDKPEKVSVKVLAGEDNVVCEVTTDPEDYGIVIGKEGSTINAMTKITATAFRGEFGFLKIQIIGAKTRLEELRNKNSY